MSLEYIRKTYSVPAKRGMRVRYTDDQGVIWNGRITSARGPHLRVLVDDRVPGYRGRLLLHPTYRVEYIECEKDGGNCGVGGYCTNCRNKKTPNCEVPGA